MRRGGWALATISFLALAAQGLGCSSGDNDVIVVTGPDPAAFTAATGGVNTVIERRCGSIDCHGAEPRAMRVYGQYGLRLPNATGLTPGSGPTTSEEATANYRSLISVEPERTTEVATRGADPYSLLVLKKPLARERHKGGPALVLGDSAERCISSWLRGAVDRSACSSAAALP